MNLKMNERIKTARFFPLTLFLRYWASAQRREARDEDEPPDPNPSCVQNAL